MATLITQVESTKDRRAFINLPRAIYKNDSAWVEPIRMELAQRINPKKNSFFRRSDAALFLARQGRKVVGRISAQIDGGANPDQSKPREGGFGFYEAIDDPAVGDALFDAACDWLRKRGCPKVVGPYNFRLEDPAPGFLVRGFEHRPMFMMPYSKPYYLEHAERNGFTPVMQLHSYGLTTEKGMPVGFIERAATAAQIPGLKIRQLEMDRLYEETELIRKIFNQSLKHNWGFVAFSEGQARAMARDLKRLADPRIILIAEVNGEPIGAVINLPNYNDILHDCKGRLFPKGLYRIMRHKKDIHGLRGYAMAVLPEYQSKGLGCLLVHESWRNGERAGYIYGEITWVLGSNQSMNDMTTFLGGDEEKQYCLVERML